MGGFGIDRYITPHPRTFSDSPKAMTKNCDILKNSYFYSIVDGWNSLPLEVRSACSVDKFKVSVIKFVTNCNYCYSF